MAYVSNQQDDEEPKNPAQGSVPPSGGAGGSSVQLAPSSGVGSAGSSPTPGQPKSGGQFATLDKYITANQGQAEPLATKITSGIGQQYNTLEGQNASTLNDIGSQVKASAVPGNASDIIAQEAANPVSFAGDQGNVKQFQSLLNASYGGPASAESTAGFSNQQNAINKAIAEGKQATTTEAGRSQLLAKNEAAPSTSVTGLNSAILSQSPTALNQVESAYKPFSNLLTGLSTGATGINQNITKAQKDAAAANEASNKQITEQVNTLNTGLTNRAQQDIAAQNKYNQSIQDFQNAWNPVNTNLNSFNEAVKTYTPWDPRGNIANPLTNLLAAPTSNNIYTPENVMTTDEASRAQAFQSLLAGLNNGLPAPLASTAGNMAAPPAQVTANPADIVGQINQSLTPYRTTVIPHTYEQGQIAKNNVDPVFNQLLQSLQKAYPASKTLS